MSFTSGTETINKIFKFAYMRLESPFSAGFKWPLITTVDDTANIFLSRGTAKAFSHVPGSYLGVFSVETI